ncbi:GNAT family acetyltransferase [Fictibacillus macauensis ZFHKF-1]|uniref:GNAT family acetyltransferase n=1 Tax=Fictibacillus macauensis ZFHKF-1 TaxID=1196324 RepID=I8UBQ4_9BACL|nr:GNAT family N-acetyltransferase [Fictibacillus macauensis]EIT84228.1 GNAT family acetyltransferase [Fictibacillus macauensis ZFHKF-1]
MLTITPLSPTDETPLSLLLLADPSIKKVRASLAQGTCYLARLQDKTIGCLVLVPLSQQTIEIMNIAVDPTYHRQGIGTQLLAYAKTMVQREGYATLEVGTGNSSIGQLAFYQKAGFRMVDIQPDFFLLHYDEPIIENGILCRDMIRLQFSHFTGKTTL